MNGNGLPHWSIRFSIYFALIVLSITLLLTGEANAGILDAPVKLNLVELKWRNYTSDGRDLLIYPQTHREAVELSLDTDVFRYFYFDSSVLGIQDDSQYRGLSFTSHVGVRLFDWLRLEHEHNSQHVLDGQIATLPRFPVYDSFTLVFTIYRAAAPQRPSLLGDY